MAQNKPEMGERIALSHLIRIPGKEDIPGEAPAVYRREGYSFDIYQVTAENARSLRGRALRFAWEFDYDNPYFAYEKTEKYIRNDGNGEVIFARTLGSNARDVGVLTQELRTVNAGGQSYELLARGMRVVLPEARRLGIGMELGRIGAILHCPDALTYETRKWDLVLVNEKTGFLGPTMPLEWHLTKKARQILEFGLLDFEREGVDLKKGVCKARYNPSYDGDFIPPDNHIRGNEIYQAFLDRGIYPDKGDVARCFQWVDKLALRTAAANYIPYNDSEPEVLTEEAISRKSIELIEVDQLFQLVSRRRGRRDARGVPFVCVEMPEPAARILLANLSRFFC